MCATFIWKGREMLGSTTTLRVHLLVEQSNAAMVVPCNHGASLLAII
jgi:hypothetical protein